MKLWLFSSGDGNENAVVDRELMQYITNPRPRFTFIPTGGFEADYFYDEFIARFESYGYKNFNMLHLDRAFSTTELNRALESDLIYLSGGNTFNLLKHARESGFLRHLNRYVASGRILAGHSAGAIMMTPTIRTASFPAHDRDQNLVNLIDWRACNLVNFEIFPHFLDTPDYTLPLMEESRTVKSGPIYALKDGAAISVYEHRLSFYGEVHCFYQGKRFTISPA